MPLTQTAIQKFRKRLQERDVELRKTIHAELVNSEDKNYSELAGRVLDSGERSVADLTADFNIIQLEKELAELAAVEAALRRMDEGVYGVCLECGGDIDERRLEIYPTAERCTECQARHENLAKDRSPSL